MEYDTQWRKFRQAESIRNNGKAISIYLLLLFLWIIIFFILDKIHNRMELFKRILICWALENVRGILSINIANFRLNERISKLFKYLYSKIEAIDEFCRSLILCWKWWFWFCFYFHWNLWNYAPIAKRQSPVISVGDANSRRTFICNSFLNFKPFKK